MINDYKTVILLTDGAKKASEDAEMINSFFKGKYNGKNSFIRDNVIFEVVNINSHTISSHYPDDIYIMPSVANEMDYQTIKEKLDILRNNMG